jgi:hypothetical protein
MLAWLMVESGSSCDLTLWLVWQLTQLAVVVSPDLLPTP